MLSDETQGVKELKSCFNLTCKNNIITSLSSLENSFCIPTHRSFKSPSQTDKLQESLNKNCKRKKILLQNNWMLRAFDTEEDNTGELTAVKNVPVRFLLCSQLPLLISFSAQATIS